MLERWNTHFSTVVEQELFGVTLQLNQDPSSQNLGTTVWDASIVLAKYLEKNSRRGEYSRCKMRGKRALELGAGMGLAGMALAILGAEVELTDIGAVLPLLQRNVDQNISRAALKLKDAAWAGEVGPASVSSLDWADPACYAAFRPPYDFLLAADCVYSELAVPHLLATVLHMSGPRSTVIVANEFRSQAVHDIFMSDFGTHFAIRKVAPGKMDPAYQHSLIHIYLLKRRKEAKEEATVGGGGEGAGAAEAGDEVEAEVGDEADPQLPAKADATTGLIAAAAGEGAEAAAALAAGDFEGNGDVCCSSRSSIEGAAAGCDAPSQQQFQERRLGVMMARALKDVKL